ncbi:Kelch repeat-containing protein [Idiomarina sp.]|uniref:Kelch repeat-containing protein n=1 Tax=Idiomarina sp. TaxID=1874361 RepID=UPI003A8E89BC
MPSSNFTFRLVPVLFSITLFAGCASAPDNTVNEPSINSSAPTLDKPRYGHAAVTDDESIYIIGGANKSGFLSSIEIIDPKTKETTVLQDKIIPRRYLTAVWDGKESIYIFGGISQQDGGFWQEKTVEIFNTRTQKVTTTTPMRVPRRFNSAVLLNDKIYVLGGSVYYPKAVERGYDLRATSLVTAFDINTKKWSRVANLSAARSTRAFTTGEQVCAVGGYDGFHKWSVFDCYDPTTGKWQLMPDAPTAISAHSVAVHNDKLYVFGDYDNLDQVLIYDFSENTWSNINIPYRASRHNATVVFGNEAFVIGGNTGGSGPFLDDIQVFSLPLL